jgi:hypothetical protein
MSGYFSRIARQGGARIARDRGQRTATPAAKRESNPAPLDLVETVMVPPRASSGVPASRRQMPNVDAAIQDQRRLPKMPEQATSAPASGSSGVPIDPATEISPAEAKRPQPLEPVVEEVKLFGPEATPDSSHVAISTSPTPEHVLLSSSSTPEERQSRSLKPIVGEESPQKIPAHSRTAETSPEESSEKKFFEKTVEIVEGQTARPAEVHTILLREVQEWIAAGQTALEDVTLDVADSVAGALPDIPLPSEREPGVVRIREGRRAKAAPEPVQEVSTTDFSEQHFELSIGSISVVVEGDERTPATAPPQVAAQPAARETPRRTSRLSRHYL